MAKFFKPANILHLETALQNNQGDFYVAPQSSTLCWLFPEDILKIENENGDDSTVALLAERLESLSMPNFEEFSAILQKLILELEWHLEIHNLFCKCYDLTHNSVKAVLKYK